jgi:LemA protein
MDGVMTLAALNTMEVAIAAALLAFAALLAVVILYNGLAVRSVRVKNAFSQIDVQLRRRCDLIPNLVEAVKGYMQHERSTLEAVIRARGELSAATGAVAGGDWSAMRALAGADAALGGALAGLFARIEAYPDLKASASFLSLQEQLVSTENRVAFARQAFNDEVMRYNEAVVTFPGSVIAGAFGFHRAEQWTTADETRAVPSARISA